jgi:hypothetical protein
MAVATQILVDGPRNTIAKVTGDATAVITNQVLLDPSTLSSMLPGFAGNFPATLLRVDHIDYSITDGVIAQLIWNSSTPTIMAELYGRGKIAMHHYGGWQNPNVAGTNGQILLTTAASGAAFPTEYSILLVLHTVKFRPQSVGGA